jgi:hypothetical protein
MYTVFNSLKDKALRRKEETPCTRKREIVQEKHRIDALKEFQRTQEEVEHTGEHCLNIRTTLQFCCLSG